MKRKTPGVPLRESIAVAIPERGLTAFWDGTDFVGDPEIADRAFGYAAIGYQFELTPSIGDVTCGTDTPDGILASLLAACGGRGVVLGDPPGITWGRRSGESGNHD